MNTPVKVKKSRQNQGGTPIPATRRRHIASPVETVYNPPVLKLKKNYDVEFERFLQSAKLVMDYLDNSERETLSPMRKQLRRFHKESNNYDVYFKSQGYWKFFYKGLIDRCDDIMDCFRFDDLRSVHIVVESHKLPKELISFVTQQLMEWRELFEDVEWMKTFRRLSQQVEKLQQEREEQEQRLKLLQELGVEFEISRLNIHDVKQEDQDPKQLSNNIIASIEELQDPTRGLKSMPMLSKKISVKRWYKKHYDPHSQTTSDHESEEESSSDEENSSLFNDASNSNIDDAADLSNEESDNDNDFEAFFSD
ncbi:hypothetical protein CAEBREN_07674 [Caenorhabditis brenneri]|uniref:Uncharacterized protein n=1 Tax=Caenorhabditis brenneri TaxID=135651 RepID=G0MKI0_CAEBE|nr:hypothetical protein CAEBREN_07674 [Caenorhabditis brenneri]